MERNRFFRRGRDITQERNVQGEGANPIDCGIQIEGVPDTLKHTLKTRRNTA
jgi:hypothetical protein